MVGITNIIKGTKDKITLSSKQIPKHIAIVIDGCEEYAKQNQKELNHVYETEFLNIKNTIKIAAKLDIPLLTFYSRNKIKEQEIDQMIHFFELLLNWEFVKENQIKISVLGKWYDLPDRLVEPIKKIISETKEYDKFFVNFCINYDGQQEILDSCKLIAQQAKMDKISPEAINKALIKENIYSSYFLPPQIILITGNKKTTGGVLLWDSSDTIIHFANILWPEFGKNTFLKAIQEFQQQICH